MMEPVKKTDSPAAVLRRYLPFLTLDEFCHRAEPKGSPPKGAAQSIVASVLDSVRGAIERDISALERPD